MACDCLRHPPYLVHDDRRLPRAAGRDGDGNLYRPLIRCRPSRPGREARYSVGQEGMARVQRSEPRGLRPEQGNSGADGGMAKKSGHLYPDGGGTTP